MATMAKPDVNILHEILRTQNNVNIPQFKPGVPHKAFHPCSFEEQDTKHSINRSYCWLIVKRILAQATHIERQRPLI